MVLLIRCKKGWCLRRKETLCFAPPYLCHSEPVIFDFCALIQLCCDKAWRTDLLRPHAAFGRWRRSWHISGVEIPNRLYWLELTCLPAFNTPCLDVTCSCPQECSASVPAPPGSGLSVSPSKTVWNCSPKSQGFLLNTWSHFAAAPTQLSVACQRVGRREWIFMLPKGTWTSFYRKHSKKW